MKLLFSFSTKYSDKGLYSVTSTIGGMALTDGNLQIPTKVHSNFQGEVDTSSASMNKHANVETLRDVGTAHRPQK